MTVLSKPNEIARETLRLLITRKEMPTPENYRRLYCEISGNPADSGAIGPHGERISCGQWAGVLRELVRMLGEHRFGLSAAEKQLAFDKTLTAGGDAPALYARLHELADAWTKLPVVLAQGIVPADAAQGAGDALPCATELRHLLAQTLEAGVAARLIRKPALAGKATTLAQQLRAADAPDTAALRVNLQSLWSEVEVHGNTQDQIQEGLLHLLRLLVENVGELVADDQWLRGQIAIVLRVISGPLDLASIETAQANLQNVILRQGLLKQSLNATKSTLKQMVASFIDELGKLSTATGDYHDSIENLSQKIRQSDDVNQLNVLLDEVLRETRNVQESALQSRTEVLRAREQVDAAELKIRELETELESLSDKVHKDHLTGALNRRGLSDAFDREIAISERQSRSLSVALLDIDNFKELNDRIGHQAGDDALVHLANVIKDTMRPSDIVARYGGEEFMILLPNTDAALAVSVVGRLQRELTKRFFLHDNRKLLITFSAGVATHAPGETQQIVTARADRALYRAKRAGKNRVHTEPAEAAPALLAEPRAHSAAASA